MYEYGENKITLRLPRPSDGFVVSELISQCPPLDTNSTYCNLLQCTHFSRTSVVAELRGEIVGFISGYVIPDRPNCLFIWQVAVAEQARGVGLALSMLRDILERNHNRQISAVETTITESNIASWALFERLAQELKAPFNKSVFFDSNKHFAGNHESELLMQIGPFCTQHES
ncbi:diaminobutyrate acetyltransferase [Zooshikella ganghwensis]|uniref:L-2,4-diaminobutyric acid acetyltransferase n=1 Tax=Zooshikella ganghwensis TaxID=202772 RepID=A0A4P9VVG2_9GAMM|nr:diaminobutyrate acetyltransferase [Zooshikella ganghwensis]RDH45890.1 diaminobutyrate acetyltransferase [Zooshikella ganghwensis]